MKKNIYNRFYTPERWSNVNTYNKILMEDFILELKSRKKKKSTIEQYFNDIRIICIYILLELDNKEMSELRKKDFRNMVLYFVKLNMSNARIDRLMSATRSLLTFAEDDDDYEELDINYASKVKGLGREPVREIIFLSDEEIMYIYNTLMESEQYQHALLCAIFYESCSRRTEIAQLVKTDIHEDRVVCNTRVVAKRGKRYQPLYNDLTKRAYKLYMKQRGEDNVDSLWILKTGVAAKSENLYEWVTSWRCILEKYSKEYKLFNPHSWRHSAATNYYEGTHIFCRKIGRPLTIIELQKLMNHSDISTTQKYLKSRDQEMLVEIFDI